MYFLFSSHIRLCNEVINLFSLTLPLSENKEDAGVETPSINSTPASDTFYTATSVLSPDPHDLTSPLSPLPLDVPHLGNIKNTENSNTGACGALVDKQSDVFEVPIEDVKKIRTPHSKNYSNISCSQFTLPVKDNISSSHKTQRRNDEDASCLPDSGKARQVEQDASYSALLLSPIHIAEDFIHSQDFHSMHGKAASTPYREEIVKPRLDRESKNIISRSCSLQADLSEPSLQVPKTLSQSDAVTHKHPYSVDNESSESINNNIHFGNGNPDCSQDFSHISKESHCIVEDNAKQNEGSPDSSDWYPGLSIREKSELISQETEVGKAAEVLMRLRERRNDSDISIGEQVCYRLQLDISIMLNT